MLQIKVLNASLPMVEDRVVALAQPTYARCWCKIILSSKSYVASTLLREIRNVRKLERVTR